jgi:hypothetical protein
VSYSYATCHTELFARRVNFEKSSLRLQQRGLLITTIIILIIVLYHPLLGTSLDIYVCLLKFLRTSTEIFLAEIAEKDFLSKLLKALFRPLLFISNTSPSQHYEMLQISKKSTAVSVPSHTTPTSVSPLTTPTSILRPPATPVLAPYSPDVDHQVHWNFELCLLNIFLLPYSCPPLTKTSAKVTFPFPAIAHVSEIQEAAEHGDSDCEPEDFSPSPAVQLFQED